MIELTTSLVMMASIASSLYGGIGSTAPQTTSSQTNGNWMEVKQENAEVDRPMTLKEHVKEYYKDTPILIDIARCESQFRQFDKSGNPIRGTINDRDVGLMQINEIYHESRAKALGYDIRTLDGNMAYAKALYEKEGVTPWASSAKCWKNYQKLASAATEGTDSKN